MVRTGADRLQHPEVGDRGDELLVRDRLGPHVDIDQQRGRVDLLDPLRPGQGLGRGAGCGCGLLGLGHVAAPVRWWPLYDGRRCVPAGYCRPPGR
jgi:hypothetical protein